VAGVAGVQVGIGALLLVALLGAAGARWDAPVRPRMLVASGSLPIALLAVAVALFGGLELLYPWARPGGAALLSGGRAVWLDRSFFLGRACALGALWLAVLALLGDGLRAVMARSSAGARQRLARRAVASLLLLVPSVCLAFWDWTMSLEPAWRSTVHGVYGLAGALQGGVAGTLGLSLRGTTDAEIAARRDLAKLLVGASLLWIYLWFCELLIVWYAALPEEMVHYAVRWSGPWAAAFWLAPIGGGAVPLVLLSARARERTATLGVVSAVALGARSVDVLVLVGPATASGPTAVGCLLAATLAVLGGGLWLGGRLARTA
jgi:hypothetical protein